MYHTSVQPIPYSWPMLEFLLLLGFEHTTSLNTSFSWASNSAISRPLNTFWVKAAVEAVTTCQTNNGFGVSTLHSCVLNSTLSTKSAQTKPHTQPRMQQILFTVSSLSCAYLSYKCTPVFQNLLCDVKGLEGLYQWHTHKERLLLNHILFYVHSCNIKQLQYLITTVVSSCVFVVLQ